MCDHRVLIKLKEKFYKTVIIQTMIHGNKCEEEREKERERERERERAP